jgi:hypothetical protein
MYSFPNGPSTVGRNEHDTKKHGPETARPGSIRARAWPGPTPCQCLGRIFRPWAGTRHGTEKGQAQHRHGLEQRQPLDPRVRRPLRSQPLILGWGSIYGATPAGSPRPQTLNHSLPHPAGRCALLSAWRWRLAGLAAPTGDGDSPPSPPLLLALRLHLRRSEEAGSTILLLLLALLQLRLVFIFIFL